MGKVAPNENEELSTDLRRFPVSSFAPKRLTAPRTRSWCPCRWQHTAGASAPPPTPPGRTSAATRDPKPILRCECLMCIYVPVPRPPTPPLLGMLSSTACPSTSLNIGLAGQATHLPKARHTLPGKVPLPSWWDGARSKGSPVTPCSTRISNSSCSTERQMYEI